MRVAIIGLGLIGGSLGLALKKAEAKNFEITGYVRRPEAASVAMSRGAVDRVETSLDAAVKGAGMVVIATPVLTIKGIMSRIADSLSPGCIVTDAASTKAQVMKWASELLPPAVDFIGGHPMAGREAYGMKAAEADLFQGCVYCLTPPDGVSPQAVDRLVDMVKRIGATPFFIGAEEHDRLTAAISHLPFILSAALVSSTAGEPSWDRMSLLAASGYRDLTRLASGNPEVNAHICRTNREAILHWIDRFIEELERYRKLVSSDDKRLEEALAEASRLRQKWLSKAK